MHPAPVTSHVECYVHHHGALVMPKRLVGDYDDVPGEFTPVALQEVPAVRRVLPCRSQCETQTLLASAFADGCELLWEDCLPCAPPTFDDVVAERSPLALYIRENLANSALRLSRNAALNLCSIALPDSCDIQLITPLQETPPDCGAKS